MPPTGPRPRVATVVLVALLAVGCTVEPGQFSDQAGPITGPGATEPAPGVNLVFEHGVTREPCPDAANPENGCIYLGALVDRSGPFAAYGEAVLEGAQAYWHHVNHLGGLRYVDNDGVEARFDVNLTRYVEDNRYDVQVHIDKYEQIVEEILALGVSFGTPMTREALHHYKEDDVVAAPIGWWSGWSFEPLVAESGAPYCFAAMNGVEYAQELLGGSDVIENVIAVVYPDTYGADVAAGVQQWVQPQHYAGPDRVPFAPAEHVVQVEPGGSVETAVETITAFDPDVVVFGTGPEEVATIAKEATAAGWGGLMVGMAPTFLPSMMEDGELARILTDRFVYVGQFGPLSQSGAAYRAMREALGVGEDLGGGELPDNQGWIAGWIAQYPLHDTMIRAIEEGDLTRAGMAEAVQAVTVHYAAALPSTRYGGDPTIEVLRNTFMYVPDPQAPMDLRLVVDTYVGAPTEAAPLTRPCSAG